MDRIAVLRRLASFGGWAALAFIVFVTLSPIELRPKVTEIDLEHLGAFALVGVLFAFGYPRHIVTITVLMVGAAAMLEFGQTFVPGRHGRVEDVLVKICGAFLGIGIAWMMNRCLPAQRPGN